MDLARITDEDLVAGCLEWLAEEAPDDFDGTFIRSMDDALDDYDELTFKQRQALENIVEGYRIADSYFWEDDV